MLRRCIVGCFDGFLLQTERWCVSRIGANMCKCSCLVTRKEKSSKSGGNDRVEEERLNV